MSQEMNNPTSSTPLQPMQPQQPKKNNNMLFIGVIVALLAVIAYLFMNNNKLSTQLDAKTHEFDIADSSRRAVEADYQASLVRLDELVSKNNMMDSVINDQNGEIAKLKSQINSIIKNKNATAAELGKAKRLIAQLNGKVRTYEERIAELEHQNADLTDQNTVLTAERDQAVTENVGLQQKARLGAVLHASNIRLTPIDLRRGGKKEKETGRAGRVDVLRITFDIDENRIAESGTKEIFIRITDPSGNLLSNAAYGSGSTTGAEGEAINYTILKQIALETNKPVKDVSADWKQDSDYAKGTYNIELFNDGYKVGGGSVTLK
jgi:peptidoglycan hydrolase CwlO-like protein